MIEITTSVAAVAIIASKIATVTTTTIIRCSIMAEEAITIIIIIRGMATDTTIKITSITKKEATTLAMVMVTVVDKVAVDTTNTIMASKDITITIMNLATTTAETVN
jgi:hypothetical protein